jgi:hypothetical protein
MDVPLIITLVVTATAIGTVIAIALLLDRAPGIEARPQQRRTAVVTGLVLFAWLVITSLLAIVGAFRAPVTPPGVVYPLVALPLLGLIAVRSVAPLRRLIDDPWVQSRLMAWHMWRLAGGVFVIMAALGRLPWLFALPAALGDVAVAIMAPVVARRLRRGTGRRRALAWNVFGLGDLVVAIALGATTSPGPLQIFSTSPSAELMSAYPLVLFPIFLVPVSLLAHLVSLRFLLGQRTGQASATVIASGDLIG